MKKDTSKVQAELKPAVLTKLESGEADAKMSKELATIKCDVPGLPFIFSETKRSETDPEKVGALLRRFEFFSLLKRVVGKASEANEAPRKKA